MAKKDDSLDDWRYRYPSAGVSWNFTGDPAYCQQFVGEAKNMLYQLKNRMNIAVPKLKSLQDVRLYDGGTTIIVRSIFGQDVVEINALRGGFPSCLIKLLDLPEVVPPMKWYAPGQETFTKSEGGWVITAPGGETEVEGVDYIKTYYSLSVTACNECQPLDFTICESDELGSSTQCRPYTYDATKLLYLDEPVPFFEGFPDRVPPVPPDPENHLIHSFYESGQAEIIKLGSDAQGSYFLWKAYTEWGVYPPTDITFSRTGLGYLLLKAFIQLEGKDLCKAQFIVKVDCCLKPVGDRKVEIWWEDFGTCQPFIPYQGVVYNGICKMPTSVGLVSYACIYPKKPLYAIPEIKGSCLPMEWTLTGPIAFWNSDKNDNIIFLNCLEAGCYDESTITLRDRCGTEYVVRGRPCCEDAEALSIGYTSLLMHCGHSQDLTVSGGCPPYSWSLSGGGSLNTTAGSTVTYAAPATNPNCTDNPTITVIDCCGSSTGITLAVNCYTVQDVAFQYNTVIKICCYKLTSGGCAGMGYNKNLQYTLHQWDCLGNTTRYDIWPENTGCHYPPCVNNCECFESDDCECWSSYPEECPNMICYNQPCFTLVDLRTTDMKEQGCCPLNPLTGLPY